MKKTKYVLGKDGKPLYLKKGQLTIKETDSLGSTNKEIDRYNLETDIYNRAVEKFNKRR
jgi:hypothetical protein